MTLTRSVIRKRNQTDPSQYAEYEYVAPLDEDREETDINNTPIPITSTPTSRLSEGINNQSEIPDRGDVDLPFEPENTPLLNLLAKQIEDRNPEEIIIEGENKIIDQQIHRNTGETIIHFKSLDPTSR